MIVSLAQPLSPYLLAVEGARPARETKFAMGDIH